MMITKFKKVMTRHFEMTYLSLIFLFFLDIEFIQQDDEVFVTT